MPNRTTDTVARDCSTSARIASSGDMPSASATSDRRRPRQRSTSAPTASAIMMSSGRRVFQPCLPSSPSRISRRIRSRWAES
jgi:hypothetical protein